MQNAETILEIIRERGRQGLPLERLYRAGEAWSDLIEILGGKAGIIDDVEEVVRLKHQIGQLFEDHAHIARAVVS